jgi:hypothetical protein
MKFFQSPVVQGNQRMQQLDECRHYYFTVPVLDKIFGYVIISELGFVFVFFLREMMMLDQYVLSSLKPSNILSAIA